MHPCVRATKETEFFKPGTATKYFHVKKTRFLRPGIEKQSTVSDAPYYLYPLRPGLLIFVRIFRVGNCRCVFFIKEI
jgi:hypothetical protein